MPAKGKEKSKADVLYIILRHLNGRYATDTPGSHIIKHSKKGDYYPSATDARNLCAHGEFYSFPWA